MKIMAAIGETRSRARRHDAGESATAFRSIEQRGEQSRASYCHDICAAMPGACRAVDLVRRANRRRWPMPHVAGNFSSAAPFNRTSIGTGHRRGWAAMMARVRGG
jgi:hypothetical protein